MFLNSYQSGPFLEILNPSEKSPIWSTSKPQPKKFDKDSKSYVIFLESPNSKLQIPSTDKPLALTQSHLLLQIFIHPGQPFTLELSVSDSQGTKRRVVFSSAIKEVALHPSHVRAPNCSFPRSTWTNLCIDLQQWTSFSFSSNFRTLDSITVSSFCKIRKILTVKNSIQEESLDCIGKNLEFPAGVQFVNTVVAPDPGNFKRIEEAGSKTSKKIGKRPPITTAPLEKVKRLNLLSGVIQQKQGKTANTFYVKKDENKVLEVPNATGRNDKNAKQDSSAGRRFSVGGNSELHVDEPYSPIPLEINLQESPQVHLQEMRLNDFQYLNNVKGTLETSSNSIEEEIVIESCELDENGGNNENEELSNKHNFFPQNKVEEVIDKPTFFANGLNLATQYRPFTPPFIGITRAKVANTEEIPEEVPEIQESIINFQYEPIVSTNLKAYNTNT